MSTRLTDVANRAAQESANADDFVACLEEGIVAHNMCVITNGLKVTPGCSLVLFCFTLCSEFHNLKALFELVRLWVYYTLFSLNLTVPPGLDCDG